MNATILESLKVRRTLLRKIALVQSDLIQIKLILCVTQRANETFIAIFYHFSVWTMEKYIFNSFQF